MEMVRLEHQNWTSCLWKRDYTSSRVSDSTIQSHHHVMVVVVVVVVVVVYVENP